jgi:hypothetical protein
MIHLDVAAILKWAEEKRRPKSPEGWQGYGRMGTLGRSGEAESVATSGRIPDRTPDKFFRRLFSFRRGLKLRIANKALLLGQIPVLDYTQIP